MADNHEDLLVRYLSDAYSIEQQALAQLRTAPDIAGHPAIAEAHREHLEIAGYEQLRRVAERAGDERAAGYAERIAAQERAQAGRVASAFDRAFEASMDARGLSGTATL